MNPHYGFLVVLAMALNGPEPVSCWPDEPEIQNTNPAKHRPNRLPPEFANEKVQRSGMLFTLCVSETGDVARVLVLKSSGNPDIDNHFTAQLSNWIFPPAERDRKRVRSVVSVTVFLCPK